MSEIKSLSFPDTNVIDMSGGRFEIHGSEIVDISWGESFVKGFGAKWDKVFTGDVSEAYDPYVVELDGEDPRALFSRDELIEEAVGVYGFKFRMSDVESDSGVAIRFRNQYSPGVNNGEISVYYSPLAVGTGIPFVSVVWAPPSGQPVTRYMEVDSAPEASLEVVFLKGGGWFVQCNGVETLRISGTVFQNVKFDIEVSVDGGPFDKPVYFRPIGTYVKPYLESVPGPIHPLAKKTTIIPDNVQGLYLSFPFSPSRPGSFKFRMFGTGAHHGETEDFEIDVIDSHAKEDSVRFLTSPVQKAYHDSPGLVVCRTHGVRRIDNSGSMSTRMECICDGNPETTDAVHIDVSRGGSLYDSRLGNFPEFFMVDKTDPVQPKKYGLDYQFLRLHQGDDGFRLESGSIRNMRTLILDNGNRLYYGVKYYPQETFSYSLRMETNDYNLRPARVRAVRMSDVTFRGRQEEIPLPTSLEVNHHFDLPEGVWLIEATFKQEDWIVGTNPQAEIVVNKTSGGFREIGRAVSFFNGAPTWGVNDSASKEMILSVVVDVKETYGSLFYILADKCGNRLIKSESPYNDVDTYTESFSAIEGVDGEILFFYLEATGSNFHETMKVRRIVDLEHPDWSSGGDVFFRGGVHLGTSPTGFYAFDFVKRENDDVDLIFSQLVKSDYYHMSERSSDLIPAALAPNLVGDYKIVSLNAGAWISGYSAYGLVIPVDSSKIALNFLPSVIAKKWRGAYFYKDLLPAPGVPSSEYYHRAFDASACYIRAVYDKPSGRTIVSMLKEGDRVPFLISGKGGLYKDLASVDTDRDTMAHGLVEMTDRLYDNEADYKMDLFETISGTLIRSVDSVFGPDGYVYTVCTAYNALREVVEPSREGDVVYNTGADRYNTWLNIIDPLILTTNGNRAAPDRSGFSRGQVQSIVPIFNLYGTGSGSDYEVFTSVSIAIDNQYLVLGMGGPGVEYPLVYQGVSHDTMPLVTMMDEVMIPPYSGELPGAWNGSGYGVTHGGVAVLLAGGSIYREWDDYFDSVVERGGGVIHYIRIDTTVSSGVLELEWVVGTTMGQMTVGVSGTGGSYSVLVTGGTTSTSPIPISEGVYDLYMVLESGKVGKTEMSYSFIIKENRHAKMGSGSYYKYDFRREGVVIRGKTVNRGGAYKASVAAENHGGRIGVHEMGWAPLNNKRDIQRLVTIKGGSSPPISSSYRSRGVPNTARVGNSGPVAFNPFPSVPFVMSNVDGGEFKRHHWPNGFIFWPEHGRAVKGDSTEISRQLIHTDNIAPSSHVHKSWRSGVDLATVHIWMDSRDSGMDTFSADTFIVSGTNVPYVTVVAKDNDEDPWEEVGVIDLVRYTIDDMRKINYDSDSEYAIYSLDGLAFNLGKFEDVDYYFHPIDKDLALERRSQKVFKARDGKVWTSSLEFSSSRDERFVFSSRGVLVLEKKIERRFIGFRFDSWRTYEGYFKFDNVDFGVATDVSILSNHDVGSGLKSATSAKVSFIEDNQGFSLQNEGLDREFEFKYSIADGALFMKFMSLIDKLTFSRTPVWIIENYKSKKDSVYLCLMTGDASTQVLIDEDGQKFYSVDLKFKSVRRDT